MRGRYEKIRSSDAYKHFVALETELADSAEKNRELEKLLLATTKQLDEGCRLLLRIQRDYDALLKDYNILMDNWKAVTTKKRRWWDRMW